MFWRFGGYANISTIDTILDKNDFTLEELLDEGDLIQELKQHNAKLIDYLRDEPVLVKLLEYVVAPKLEPVATPDADDDDEKEVEAETEKGKGRVLPFSRPRASSRASEPENKEEEMEKKRNRYAYVAAEILASDNWSICEALLANKTMLRNFWDFLRHPIPLDPLQASYFTKVNEALFDKKTEEMIELLKSIDNAVPDMLRHVDCPMIMDLLLKIISLERTEAGQGIVEWLYTQDVMPTLLSFLGPEHSWATQTSAGDFMKAIITVSANASQNEQTCIGPNELTRQLVSKDCVEKLISYMLGGGNALTVGVGIVIEVIRKNNSDYDPDVGAEANSSPSSRDPIYLGTLLRLFAEHVPDFANLIMNAPAQKARLDSTFGDKIEPLGFDRFKTCELMAELLHCSNMGLLNEVGSEELIAARDSERQRLRVEGKLSALRGEDVPSSADDLTMRISHSSPADEGRRLEITNISEDDGFEEVAHSKEMTEDTSHEFVKAEEEIQAGQATSFLDKDEDDFVDEPLSSPRLQDSDAKIEEPEFDDPDLVVAPLSPSKQKANDLNELPPSPSKDEGAKVEDLVEDMQKSLLEDKPKTPEPQDAAGSADDSGTSTPAVDTPAASSVADSEATKPEVQDPQPSEAEAPSSEPQAEEADKPAPLFSQSQTAPDESVAKPEEPKDADVSDAPKETEEPQVAPQAAEPDQPEAAAGDSSILVGHEVPPEAQDLSNVQPVVGDYLKMQFVEYGIVPTILSFFFKYPWNNFLHNVVYDIVQQVFNGPMDRGFNPTLAISLFESADITSQIINGQQTSEQSQQQNKTRMGYMGHLTLIAEEVVKFTERHPPELLSETVLQKVMDQEWINYVEGALAETRERDNAILGGVRPEVAMSNRQAGGLSAVGLSSLGAAFGSSQGGSSNALADAGLNGGLNDISDNGGGNGIGPFAISSGTLMSGFGSSSDEDEDEEAENEEDVNNEVGILPFAPSQPRPRRPSGLSSFAGRPVPRLFTRSASGFYGSEDCIEDSDSDDPERSCPDLDDDHDHDSADEDELEPRKMSQTKIASPMAGGPRRASLAEPMDDFEDVSLGDESDSHSLGHLSPDEWEDVEDQDSERTDIDLTGPVQQVDDRAMEQETDIVGQADDDSDPLFSLLISVNFPSDEEMQPRRARRDPELHEGMLLLVRELFHGKYPDTFLDRMADILSCPPGSPPSEHDMRVQACLVEIGRLVQKSSPPDEATSPEIRSGKFRAYTDPLNTSGQSASNSLNPPSIPPPPPPPPPLNIPPSRARMAFAARLASKRKEAEEAGEDGELGEDKGLGSLLQQGKEKEGDEQLRNPFADDEDDDEQSDDEDEEDDEGDLGRGDNSSGQGSSWNRGGWWRGALGNRKGKSTKETFGDGRDSSDSEDEAEAQAGDGGNSSDEEFGDFAMPETSGAAAETGGATSGFDAEREKVLVKPMPVHPPGGGGGNKGNFLGLWPFAKKDKDSSPTKEEAGADKEKTTDAAATPEKPVEAQAADETAKEDKEKDAATEKDGVKEDEKTKAEPPVVLSEDGEKVQPAIEAKRRTSIEEPDEGDEVVV